MKDYISREEFIATCEDVYCKNCDRRKNSKGKMVYEIGDMPCRACDIMCVLDDAERFPAADVAPVVRCRDCKKGWPAGEYVYCMKPHAGHWPTHKWDWYCADGERKEDAK